MTRGGALGAATLVLAMACGAISSPATSPAPINSCKTDDDCKAYQQAGTPPRCDGGRCLVLQPLAGNLTAVISLAEDAPIGAGDTFAVAQLLAMTPSPLLPAAAGCTPTTCAQLPALTGAGGVLLCEPSAAIAADFNLGGVEVAIPAEATFTPQIAQGSGYVDATVFGLPLLPVRAETTPNPGKGTAPGPGGGPSVEFLVQGGIPPLSSPLSYERRLAPQPPFDKAYPPDVVQGRDPQANESPTFNGFDATRGTDPGGNPTLPMFTFARADGGRLDGWTAYLRDVSTLRPLSQVAELSGVSQSVTLLTSHHPVAIGKAAPDALTGAQLVLVPASSTAYPTWIYTPINGTLLAAGTFPKLPPGVGATISVVTAAGAPADADLVFEAIDICRYSLNGTAAAPDYLAANHDFSFVVRATASGGTAHVELPLGGFRVTAIPHDDTSALTLVTELDLADSNCNPIAAKKIELAKRSVVSGTAILADMRPLAAATVEFVPTNCSDSERDPACMPRPALTTTNAAGAYSASLDPGSYLLRVRPAEGSGLPWVVQPLTVSPTAMTPAPVIIVPAPVDVGVRLFDSPIGNPLAEAFVRVFQTPATGAPYEIGEAITDSTGHFDMYLSPAAQ